MSTAVRRRSPLVVLLTMLLASGASAQPDEPPPADVAFGLERMPVVVETMGLTIHPPAGAAAKRQRVESRTALVLVDGARPPVWSMRIQPLIPPPGSPVEAYDPAARLDLLLASLGSTDRPHRVLRREARVIAGRVAQICYAEHETTPGQGMVSGWLIIPHGPRELLVVAIQVMPEQFPRLEAIFDASFGTLRLRDPAAIADERAERLARGRALIEGLTPERLRTRAGRQTWYRHYLPAAVTGSESDTELGYFGVEIRDGMLGAINPTRDPARYDPSEQEVGLLVSVLGHYLEPTAGSIYDSGAHFWMAWDQSHEAWSVRGTRRWRGRTQSEAQTGIRTRSRTGDPRGTITVIGSRLDGATRDEKTWSVPEAYLSQALPWLLGGLLPREPEGAVAFSSYCFDHGASALAISMRHDRWEPHGHAADWWVLTSQPSPDTPSVVSIYDAEGDLVRRTWPEGSVAERTLLEDLYRLWEAKGLPTGALER